MSAGSSPIRILAVDDHALVREGVAGLIGIQSDMIFGGAGVQRSRGYPGIPHPSVTIYQVAKSRWLRIQSVNHVFTLTLTSKQAG